MLLTLLFKKANNKNSILLSTRKNKIIKIEAKTF